MAGSTSARCRSISNEALPDPMITAARSSVTATVPDARILPDLVSAGEMIGQSVGVFVAEPTEIHDP